jgi:hypothetical protein
LAKRAWIWPENPFGLGGDMAKKENEIDDN